MKQILDALGLCDLNPGTYTTGGWLPGSGGELVSVSPTDGSEIARVSMASAQEYERVITASREAFEQWRILPAPARGEAVRLIGEELRRHKDALGSLVSLEMGKIKAEGDGEVQEMIDIADFAVGQSRMLYGNTMHSERPLHRMYEQWHPLGLVGIVTAFNFPVAVYSWNALMAAICGNVSIWKPSPKTPLCGIAVQRMCARVMEDNGFPAAFQMFVGDNDLASTFVDDERVDLLSFTGSCAIGRQVGARVQARMGRPLLELGGNNAIIVDQDANLGIAVPGIVFGSVGTAGQRCTSTRRLFVHESQIDSLSKTLVNAYKQVKIGNPLDADTLMGPLIDADSVARFEAALAAARDAGGEVLCGGEVLDGPGNFVTPAIVKARNEWPIVQDETFAPILYIIPYSTLDEAIRMQNDVRQGLSSAIFTNNLQNAERYLSAIGSDCGIANVNIGTSGAEIGGAFGGEKETGGGREAGSDSWRTYMRRQTNTINWGSDLPLAQGVEFNLE